MVADQKEQVVVEKLRTEFSAVNSAKIKQVIENLAEADKKTLFDEFKTTEIDAFTRERLNAVGLNDLLVKTYFELFLGRKFLKDEEYDFVFFARSKGYEVGEEDGKHKITRKLQVAG